MQDGNVKQSGIEPDTSAEDRAEGDVYVGADWDTSLDGHDARPLLHPFDENNEDASVGSLTLRNDLQYIKPRVIELLSRYLTHWRTGAVLTLLTITILAVALPSRNSDLPFPEPVVGPYWKGFDAIEHYFAFGDSWTTTHFWVEGDQPSFANPIGNPAYPGLTSTNGANYVGFLTAKYNQSFIKTFDFAYGASTIDASIDRPFLEWLDFPHQLSIEFIKYYINNVTGVPQPIGWTAENSLFSTFFGINDVIVYDRSSHEINHVFATYEKLIGRLYDMSVRNFLIINIPPIDLSPAVTEGRTRKEQESMAADMMVFNNLVTTLIMHLQRTYKDITIFPYNVHDLFGRVITNASSVSLTCGYKNTTKPCKAYDKLENGEQPTQAQLNSCDGLRWDEFLWLNSLHATEPVHEAMAFEIQQILTAHEPV